MRPEATGGRGRGRHRSLGPGGRPNKRSIKNIAMSAGAGRPSYYVSGPRCPCSPLSPFIHPSIYRPRFRLVYGAPFTLLHGNGSRCPCSPIPSPSTRKRRRGRVEPLLKSLPSPSPHLPRVVLVACLWRDGQWPPLVQRPLQRPLAGHLERERRVRGRGVRGGGGLHIH